MNSNAGTNEAYLIENSRLESEQQLLVWKAVFEYAQIAFRTIVLANGAGATAMVTLLGTVSQYQTTKISQAGLSTSAMLFAFGVAAGVMSSFFAYLSQFDVLKRAIELKVPVMIGVGKKRIIGIVAAFAGLGLFLLGVAVAVTSLDHNRLSLTKFVSFVIASH